MQAAHLRGPRRHHVVGLAVPRVQRQGKGGCPRRRHPPPEGAVAGARQAQAQAQAPTGRFRYRAYDDPWLYRRIYWSTGPRWTGRHDYGVMHRRDRDGDGDVDGADATYSNLFDS